MHDVGANPCAVLLLVLVILQFCNILSLMNTVVSCAECTQKDHNCTLKVQGVL